MSPGIEIFSLKGLIFCSSKKGLPPSDTLATEEPVDIITGAMLGVAIDLLRWKSVAVSAASKYGYVTCWSREIISICAIAQLERLLFETLVWMNLI